MGTGCQDSVDRGTPAGLTGKSTCSSTSFFFRGFWEGTNLELLEVPSGPRWQSGGGVGPNCLNGGDQAPNHRAGVEAHPEEARRLMTVPSSLPLPPHRWADDQSSCKWCFTGRDSHPSHPTLSLLRKTSKSWWCMPVVLALGRQRQKDCMFEADLGYIARPWFKKTKQEFKLYTACVITSHCNM